MDKINFRGKVAIVTGASSGIGAATAIAFATYGAKLTLVARNEERLMKIARECEAKTHVPPLCLLLDLNHPNTCESIIQKTAEFYGKIDILVNCAGKILISSLYDRSMETFDELFNINFRVPFHLSQLALPYLIKTKGNIVNIGSSMSKRYKPGFLPYIVAKSALAMFGRHAAPELISDGVRINTISPGTTRTNILENLAMDNVLQNLTYEELAQYMPHGKVIEAKEVATLVCLAASDAFPSLNGSELLVDGAACFA